MVDKVLRFAFALVAASIAATLSGWLALTIGAFLYSAAPATIGFPLVPVFAPAFFILGLFVFAPLQIVLAWRGKSGRIAHIVAAVVVTLVLLLLLGQGFDTKAPPPVLDQLKSLAPALPLALLAALAPGLTFTRVMDESKRLDLRLVAPLLIWCVALYVAARGYVTPTVSGAHWSYNPEFTREPIRGAWFLYGGPLLVLLGGAGAFMASHRPRLALALFALAIATPLSFHLWFRLTPLGPANPTFLLGDKTFSVDWRLEPLSLNKGEFGFIAEKSGPWRIASRGSANQRISISTDLTRLDSLGDRYSWERGPYEKEGLNCRDGRFERRPNDLSVVCEAKTADGHVLSHVMCELGYCSHHFRSGNLHYWLHYARDDFSKWRAFETETIDYVDRAARGELRDVLKGRKCPITYRCPEDAWLDNSRR